MQVRSPDGLVVRFPQVNFSIGKGNRKIDFRKRIIDVILTSQPGMLLGKKEGALAGFPGSLQAGGSPMHSAESIAGASRVHGGDFAKPSKLGNIVFVLDRSTSMSWKTDRKDNNSLTKMELVQQMISKLTPYIPEGSKAHLILFNGFPMVVSNGIIMNNKSDFEKNIIDEIKKIGSEHPFRAGTNIEMALVFARENLKRENEYDDNFPERNLIVFITDGDHRYERDLEKRSKIEQQKSIYSRAQNIAPLTNSTFAVIGIGEEYRADMIQNMAGFSGGFWSHLSHLKLTGNAFDKGIPNLIKNIQGSELFIRGDFYGPNRVFRTDECVYEVAYIENRVAPEIDNASTVIGLHEGRGGFSERPVFVALTDANTVHENQYRVAGQEDARLHYGKPEVFDIPENPGVLLEIFDFENCSPDQRIRAQEELKKLLNFLAIRERDEQALHKLHEAGILNDEIYNKYLKAKKLPEDKGMEESVREALTAVSEVDVSGILERAIQDDMENAPVSGVDYKKSHGHFLDQLDKLGKIIPKQDQRVPDLNRESVVDGQSFVTEEHGLSVNPKPVDVDMHSGDLGPIDKIPTLVLPPFQAGAVQVYNAMGNQGDKYKINLTIGYLEPLELDFSKKSTYTIGRSETCSIKTEDTSVSRIHCQLEYKNGKLYIKDLGSRNGTFVNGTQIEAQKDIELKPNDTVMLGNVSFTIARV